MGLQPFYGTATPISVGWFMGWTQKNTKWYIKLDKLWWNFYSMYRVYGSGHGPCDTTWQAHVEVVHVLVTHALYEAIKSYLQNILNLR